MAVGDEPLVVWSSGVFEAAKTAVTEGLLARSADRRTTADAATVGRAWRDLR